MQKRFSINEIEVLTGIKAATLRIWERRYSILQAQRINGNRQYSLLELETILHFSLLKNNGFHISRLATMAPEEVTKKASMLAHREDINQLKINELMLSMFSGDFEKFDQVLNKLFPLFTGIDDTMQQVVFPFLTKINSLYPYHSNNEVINAVSVIRRKMIYFIESVDVVKRIDKTAILFLPRNEHYDLLLLYTCYHLKLQGFKTIYLGNNIPEENIIILLNQKKPDMLYTSISKENIGSMHKLVTYIKTEHPTQKLNIVQNGDASNLYNNESCEVVNFIHYQDVCGQSNIA